MRNQEACNYATKNGLFSEDDFTELEITVEENDRRISQNNQVEITIRQDTHRLHPAGRVDSGIHHREPWVAWSAGAQNEEGRLPATRP